MVVVGGLRARLIRDNTLLMLRTALTELDWLADPAPAWRSAVELLDEPLDLDQPITPNKVSFSSDTNTPFGGELGSNLSEFRWLHFVEVYAENESIGTHLAHDLRDILEGRMPSIDRSAPIIEVRDLRQATPGDLFVVQIEDVVLDRPTLTTQGWQRHLWSIRFATIDSYLSDDQDEEIEEIEGGGPGDEAADEIDGGTP